MRRRLALVALALIVAATSGCAAMWQSEEATPAYAGDDSDAGAYYDDLAPYGTWMNVASYGWVWCPLDTPAGWSPYTVGYWLYSDDGWYWISEDPWGATPYHYGRWAYDYNNGWFWVPGDVWAPAWVAWRCSDHWVGWAPLPPECTWRAGTGLSWSAYELDDHIDRYRWSFMHARDFGTTRERVTVVPTSRNVTLIGRTKDVTKFAAGPRPVEDGMRPELIQTNGQAIERYRIVDSKTPIRKTGATVGDQEIEVYRPQGGITAVVKERMRQTPPKERPVPSRDLQNRVEREKVQLDDAVKTQRDELAKEHDQEMKDREPGASAVEMKRRQDAELKAQRDLEERQKRVIEERGLRIAKERKARPNAPETTPPPPQAAPDQPRKDEPKPDDQSKVRDERTRDRNVAPRVPDKSRDRGDQGR